MPSVIFRNFIAVLTLIFLVGCGTTSNLTARSYIDEKKRVDQDMSDGNYGFFSGTPVPEDRSQYKDTRKMYVLEFTKEDGSGEIVVPELPPRKKYTASSTTTSRRPREYEPIVLPSFEDEDSSADVSTRDTSFVDYEVQKNDTLQKISKKFYDSYSKWPLIQNANSDVLKDPNRIKEGMMLRIPVQ